MPKSYVVKNIEPSILKQLDLAIGNAKSKHPGEYPTRHHAYGVLQEEVDELFDEIKDDAAEHRFKNEALDVAVVSLRILMECK